MADIRVDVFEADKPKSAATDLQTFLAGVVGEGRLIVAVTPQDLVERAVGSRLKRVHSYLVISQSA
jgi:hypothetical protein